MGQNVRIQAKPDRRTMIGIDCKLPRIQIMIIDLDEFYQVQNSDGYYLQAYDQFSASFLN